MKKIYTLLTVIVFTFVCLSVYGQSTKALYVNGFKTIIGKTAKETDLLEFAQDSGYNYLILYNLKFINDSIDITDPVTAKPLRDFIVKAKTQYGIQSVGGVGEKFSSFDPMMNYNLDHMCEPNARIDVFNLEFEFWNNTSTADSGYYCETYLLPNGFPCTTEGAFDFIYPQLCQLDSLCDQYPWLKSEIYIGKPTNLQCALLAKCVDRVLIHYYRHSDVYNNGNSIYNYKKYRLEHLVDSVSELHVMPIFNAKYGPNSMGQWLETHPEAQAFDTWMNGQNAWDDETGAWKSKVVIDGYTWYKYTAIHDTTTICYYVSPTGSNSNPGTIDSAWQTLSYAVANAVPDSKIFLYGGTYNEQVNISQNYLTIKAMPGENPIIDGSTFSSGAMITITDRKGVTLEGLEVRNAIYNDAQGILLTGKNQDITIKNCTVHDIHFSSNPNDPAGPNKNAQPIIVYGDSLTPATHIYIKDNEVYDCRTGYSEAMAINGNVDTFEVVNNHIHDITNIGIDFIGHEGVCQDADLDQARNGLCAQNVVHNCQSDYAASAGIYVDGAQDIIVERNTSFRNQWGIEVGCENTNKIASGITVQNNVIYNNAKSGIVVGGFDYPDGSGKVSNAIIFHNSLFNNDTTNNYEGELQISYVEGLDVKGNILYGTNTQNILILQSSPVAPVGVAIDTNLYYFASGTVPEFEYQNTTFTGLSQWQDGTGFDASTIVQNPSFYSADIAAPNLHIFNNSPGINKGRKYNYGTDRDGIPRPLEGFWDLGAYELGKYWIGAENYTWRTPGNWSDGAIPTQSDIVTIPGPKYYDFYPKIIAPTQVKAVYINPLVKLLIAPGGLLHVK